MSHTLSIIYLRNNLNNKECLLNYRKVYNTKQDTVTWNTTSIYHPNDNDNDNILFDYNIQIDITIYK